MWTCSIKIRDKPRIWNWAQKSLPGLSTSDYVEYGPVTKDRVLQSRSTPVLLVEKALKYLFYLSQVIVFSIGHLEENNVTF